MCQGNSVLVDTAMAIFVVLITTDIFKDEFSLRAIYHCETVPWVHR